MRKEILKINEKRETDRLGMSLVLSYCLFHLDFNDTDEKMRLSFSIKNKI